jgi:putative ABC transport system permease protein
MLSSLWEDLRFAVRLLIRQPAFTAAAIALLALGIGANSAIFSLVDSVLLKPLPYKDLNSLYYVLIQDTVRGRPPAFLSVPEFLEFQSSVRGLSHMAGLLYQPVTIARGGEPVRVSAAFASRGYFEALGVPIAYGRPFRPEEYESKHNQAALLSDGLWKKQFGGDPSVIGSTLSIDNEIHVIAGILPALEGETRAIDLYLPMPITPALLAARDGRTMHVVARLAPGVTKAQVSAELRAVSQRVAQTFPDSNTGMLATLKPVMDEARGSASQPLTVLAAAVGLVLLVACANLASLLLVRASGRLKEIAIRSAMGASQGRIFRQMITESVVLSICGGAAGLFLASWCVSAIKNWGVLALPRLNLASISNNVLAFTFLLSIAAGVLLGAVPAWQILRLRLAATLNEESRGSSGSRGRGLTRTILVVVEVAISVVLLVSAGLLLRTYAGLTRLDMGFQPAPVLTMRGMLPVVRYAEDESRAQFVRQVVSRLGTLPGVAAAGSAAMLPMMSAKWFCQFSVDGSSSASLESVSYNTITPGYFESIGTPILRGRPFSASDSSASPPVVIISQALATRYFPSQDPIGNSVTLKLNGQTQRAAIVGVVRNMAQEEPNDPGRAVIYQPHAQRPWPFFFLTLRADGVDPASLAAAASKAVYEIDPEVPMDRVQPLSRFVDRTLSQQQLAMVLLTAFSALAMILAAIGLYGVLAVAVAQRRREFGIRMALGANQSDILSLIFRNGMGLTITGLIAGLIAAPMASYALKQMLYGVTFIDPLTFAAVSLLILGVSAAACFPPARRASRVDPATALRD